MEAMGNLAGGIAHDFNNILTTIIGYANLLEMKLDKNDSSRSFVEHILTAADRAANLTKSLLTFGKKQSSEPRVVDLRGIVQGVEKFLLRLVREDFELQTTIADDACMVFADSGQIEQILMNLTTNARDAMHNGGKLAIATSMISLDRDFVATHGYGAPGRFVLLTVTDTGTGMDAETRIRIFEPFFTTKEVGKGTGLGLSMVYGIVKQHSGYITCYSEPGEGTTFRIYLPAVDALAEPVPESSAGLLPGGTETILMAEDDEQVRMLTHKLLESLGYTVIEARDGNDALKQFFAHQDVIQLALLDVIMPGKNGREAYEEMRKKVPGLKALFTSGYSADIFQCNEFNESNFAFISKPSLPTELSQKIRQMLDE
jgi:two-component system, cell cycle sensor histidine kinase and response regulator CckA